MAKKTLDSLRYVGPELIAVNTNPIEDYEYRNETITRTVSWTTPNLRVTRLRCISDRGFPYWDISYCHGMLNGEYVSVQLPFHQIPKPYAPEAEREGFGRGFIINAAKRDGVFAKGLGILDAISQTQG